MTQILVVEDEGIIALDLQEQLRGLGYAVSGRAASGREAIEKVVTCQPDLVLMDIRLKGDSDGVDIAQEIREQFNIPVIYITASNDEETLQRAMVTEPFGYLVKPVEATTLYVSIEMALHKYRVEETLRESYKELKRQAEDREGELSRANRLLRQEIAERRQIEKALRKAREDLEKRVEERTLDLRRANERLLSEIVERKQAESAEQEQRTLAEALRDAAVTFSSTFNLDEVLEHILNSISIVVPHDAAVVALTETEADHIALHREQTPIEVDKTPILHFSTISTSVLSELTRNGKTLFISDLREYSDGLEYRALLKRIANRDIVWAQSLAGTPIYIDGEIAGVFVLLSRTPGFFTFDYKERMEVLANQIAIAIKNARLYESKRSLRVLSEALRDTTAALQSTFDVEKVMTILLENVGRVVSYDTANIMLIESNIGYIACSQGYAEHEVTGSLQSLRFPIAETPNLQQMVTSGQPCIIPDVRGFPGWDGSQYAIWLRSYAGAPIRLDGKVIGFLNLESGMPNFYTAAHAERLQVFADQVAVAIRNAKLFEDERRERLTSQTLQKTAEALVSSVNLGDVLDRVIDLLREIVDYNYATVMLLEVTLLRVVATYDASRSSQTLGTTFAYAKYPLLNEALSSDGLMVIPDTQLDARWMQQGPGETEIRTWIGVPLVASDTIIGLLTIGSDKPHAFSTHDLEAIKAFAQQAALAVRNAIIIVELDKNLTELQEAQARLMRVARLSAAGETAAGVAHQINNPLGAIIGQAHMLLADLPPDSQDYHSVEIIKRAAYRAGSIVQRMLDLTKKRSYDFHPVDINQSVQDAVMLIKAQIEPHIAKLNVRLAPELPLVKGSKEHLEDVWLNLLLNARDAIIGSEHGEINVTTGISAKDDLIEVVVADNGKGISPDDMKHLFQPFFTSKEHGIGLGLSICQDMIDQHHGTIQVESKVGQGTTITVRLPVGKI